jgi:hypothetical protein
VCCGLVGGGRSEVIDRIIAVIDGHIITASDLRQERQIRGLLAEKAAGDAALVKEMIDSYLINQEMVDYPNIDVSTAEIDEEIEKLKIRPSGDMTNLRSALQRRVRVQKFFDLKFRQSIRPSDDEIRKYYDDVFVPEARKRGMNTIPALTDPAMNAAIRDNVIQENLDREVEVWLEALRRRSNVEVFQ